MSVPEKKNGFYTARNGPSKIWATKNVYPRQRHTRAVELWTASSRSSAIVTPVSWLAGSSERALRSSTAGISPLDRRSTQPVNTRGSIDAQVPAAEVSSIVWRLSGLRRRMKQ